jgi:TatD DNase family protein
LQLELACQLCKPIFIHEKEAHEDLIAILAEYQGRLPRIILHSFTGTSAHAKKYLEMGMYLGITGDCYIFFKVCTFFILN